MRLSRQPKLSAHDSLAVKPVQLVKAELDQRPDGGANLKVPLKPTRWSGWFLRVPEGATKTFELDALGLLVWNSCDGRTSVQQIIRKLAKRYNLNLREAQVPTVGFLQTLVRKGLVGMPVEQKKAKTKDHS